jgi:hypothetical protein
MNRSIRFGYHAYTFGYFIKLNVKIRENDAKHFGSKYPGISIIHNGNFGYRIEGTIKNDDMARFVYDLDVLKLDYKIESLIHKKQSVLDHKLPVVKTLEESENPLFPF